MFGIEPIASSDVRAVDRAAVVARRRTPCRRRGRSRSPARPSAASRRAARNSSSSTAATSGSFVGSTCWRDTTSVTCEPSALNMCVNSTPVTPEPITHEVLGDLRRRVRLAGREDALAVDRRPVGDARARPGREHDRSRRRAPRCPSSVSATTVVRAREPAGARGSGARPATRAGSRTDVAQVRPRSTRPARAARRRRGGPRRASPIVRARRRARRARRRSRSSPSTGCSPTGARRRRRCRAR